MSASAARIYDRIQKGYYYSNVHEKFMESQESFRAGNNFFTKTISIFTASC